ncbi:MAG: hypothetical protein WC178_00405 [Candidatus Paceibacterota bacterium]
MEDYSEKIPLENNLMDQAGVDKFHDEIQGVIKAKAEQLGVADFPKK